MCNCENEKKPPLGLMPTEIWLRMRVTEIFKAMKRYREANKAIPMAWVDELLMIDKALDDLKSPSDSVVGDYDK